ncbi:molybdopterin-dependent oxidoreductase [Deltaproteobacteria bacterium TL4]
MKKGLSRRNLFKYMAIGGTAATVAGCEKKPEKLIPLFVPPDGFEYVPHSAYQYMTTCQECEAGCGMMVTTREGRAQKAEGNPHHPINQGALCARGQASMQALYNPSRIKAPQDKGSGPLTWAEAETRFADQVKVAKGQVVYLSKALAGSNASFTDQWLESMGGGKRVGFEVFNQASLKKANEIAFDRKDIPVYALDQANFLLNFSTDFMETWGNAVENSRRFSEMHAYQNGQKKEFVHVGPHVSLTGAKADQWIAIKPGTEGLVALSMAQVLQQQTLTHTFLQAYLKPYAPEQVASKVGISANVIRSLAGSFVQNGPSLAIGGGNLIATEQNTDTLVAINVLNAVAGNVGKTIFFQERSLPENASHWNLLQLIADLNADHIKLLIIDEVNPVYALPAKAEFLKALEKTFVVSLASTQSETTQAANLVLPTLTAYESWGDVFPRAGVRNIIQPVMVPVNAFDARAKEEILLAVGRKVEPGLFNGIASYLAYLKNKWKTLVSEPERVESFETHWLEVLQEGGVFQEAKVVPVELNPRVTAVALTAPAFEGVGLTVLPSNSVLMGDGRGANKPWLQEVPDPLSQIIWDSWAEIHPDTAKALGITDRDVIEVSTPYGKLNMTAYFSFGVHKEAISIPFGQGHTHSGEAADGFGINVLHLLPAKTDPKSGELAWVSVNAEVKPTAKLSYTANMDGNPRQLGRGIAGAVTVKELKQGEPPHEKHKRPTDFYPPRSETAGYYKPYRWGMTIDLDRCNGCSACVVACYAENNIPVVGKMRAAVGREMSWIRLERYIEGYDSENLEYRFAPMACQQCGNAGCEAVCPVYATYHNPEGLNAQVYNRCVGTRYCSNNCIYKARRFNWFNYEFPAPLDQQLNSTITTRDKGVMEKCTFCVQRIREAQNEARQLGRDVRDGEIVTACQQTCPTKAITFGNLMDPESEVSRLAKRGELETKRDRQYEVLAEINYKPAITYLKKVNLHESSSPKHEETESHGFLKHQKNETQEA